MNKDRGWLKMIFGKDKTRLSDLERENNLLEKQVTRLQEEKKRLMDQCYINCITGNTQLCFGCEFKDECRKSAVENSGYDE